jgi:hypothetical protein
MKSARFSEEQIVGILQEQEAGTKTAEVLSLGGVGEVSMTPYQLPNFS